MIDIINIDMDKELEDFHEQSSWKSDNIRISMKFNTSTFSMPFKDMPIIPVEKKQVIVKNY